MRFNRSIANKKRGSALALVLMVLLIVSVLTVSLIGISTSNFKMTKIDSDSQSVYYIAEAGINNTIDIINTKVNELYISVDSANAFFSDLESYMNTPFVLSNFESNFGRVPTVTTTVTGSRVANTNYADYTLTSIGRIGNSKKTVSTIITANWITPEETTIMENIFIYGPELTFEGNSVNGKGGSIVSGALYTHNLNGGASLNVSNMYFGGPVTMDGGSASFGSMDKPGNIYVRGNLNLWNGTRDVYGDVYVYGDFKLKDAKMHGDVYVDGNLELGWTTTIYKKIFYTGTLTSPLSYPRSILDKCVKVASISSFTIPTMSFKLKDNSWYSVNGYSIRGNISEKNIPNSAKMLVDSYYSDSSQSPTGNIIIVSKGNIDIRGWRNVTGVLIAPNGSVSYEGGSFTGLVISKNGFSVTRGGTFVNMLNICDFFTDATMPFTVSGSDGTGGGAGTGEGTGDGSTEGRLVIKSSIKEK